MKKNIVKHIMMILAFFAISSNAVAQLVWDGTSSPWTHGTGTETDPYLIETPQNLAWLSDMVNNGVSTYSGVYFKQTEDFDMNGTSHQFNPIGKNSTWYFSGTYDGNFMNIYNLVISNFSSPYYGLFGYISNANLLCICLHGISCTASTTSSYTSDNSLSVGSLCGYAYGECFITQCCCVGDVVFHLSGGNSAYTDVNIGGLIGYAGYSIDYNTIIAACYFIGNVNVISSGDTYYGSAGMLIGYLYDMYRYSSSTVYFYRYTLCNCYSVALSQCACQSIIGQYASYNRNNPTVIVNSYNIFQNNSYCGPNLPATSEFATNRTDAYMKSAAMPLLLNSGLSYTAFVYDTMNVNNGYPIFAGQVPVRYWVNTIYDSTQGSVTGMGSYASGTTATLQAEAAEGYLFTGWSDGNIENPRTVTVTSDSTYTAVFTKNAYTIHVKQDCSVSVQ